MDIIVGVTSGFCQGVNSVVNNAIKNIENTKDGIYCLGEIVHNGRVIFDLENKGMKTVNDINDVPNNSKMIIRAHGEVKDIYKIAKEKNIDVIDLTCPNVKRIHEKIEKAVNENYFIIIVGKKLHPEVTASKSYAGENYYVLESSDEILDAYMEFEKTYLGKVYVVSQTTFSRTEFEKLSNEIYDNFAEAEVVIDNTICNATENRQLETEKISKDVNKMIIIGGKNSSNTKELANVAQKNCSKVYLISDENELNLDEFKHEDKIGIMAGASTPKILVDEIIDKLKSI